MRTRSRSSSTGSRRVISTTLDSGASALVKPAGCGVSDLFMAPLLRSVQHPREHGAGKPLLGPYNPPMTAPVRGEPVRLDPPGPEPAGLGRYGEFGGRFVPEALVPALQDLEHDFRAAWADDGFRAEYADLLTTYAGRPTPVTECRRLSDRLGVRVLLKREDLTHTGSHKINNVLGQALLTRRMGKKRVIAETGAGQHGVATATAAALFGLKCTIYMGRVDTERQALNVARMRLLGAEVVSVDSGSATLKDAINEAFRDWVTNVENTYYVFGTVGGPHPFPLIVRD